MPIYQYRCSSCHSLFEILQRINDPPLQHCQYCSGEVRRIISPVGLIFKGSGFHVTDYKGNGSGRSLPEPDSTKGSEKKATGSKPSEKTSETGSGKSDDSPASGKSEGSC